MKRRRRRSDKLIFTEISFSYYKVGSERVELGGGNFSTSILFRLLCSYCCKIAAVLNTERTPHANKWYDTTKFPWLTIETNTWCELTTRYPEMTLKSGNAKGQLGMGESSQIEFPPYTEQPPSYHLSAGYEIFPEWYLTMAMWQSWHDAESDWMGLAAQIIFRNFTYLVFCHFF